MEAWVLAIILFGCLILFLATGLPVSFTLGGLGVIFGFILWGGPAGLFATITTAYGKLTEFVLVALPLFIFMAAVLQYSGLADDLYDMAHKWLAPVKGGLAMGTVVVCAVFAAMAGISTVATATMGVIALPSMRKRNYDKLIAVGCISAGGALGILIPPSIIMIVYGVQAEVSIGKLFMGGVIPGIILAVIFIIYIAIRCLRQPELGPAIPKAERPAWGEKLAALRAVALPLILIIVVLGAIYTGVCTPTEAAGIGAFGALVCTAIRRRLNWTNMKGAFAMAVRINAMVCWIMIGAVSFSRVIAVSGVGHWVCEGVGGLSVSPWIILIIMQLVFFFLGMFLDPMGIIMITSPIFVPIIRMLGFSPLWFGVLFTINMEMAYITPPFGFNLFVMKGVVPPDVSMMDIYRSIIPFVGLQALCLALVMIFPQLALWLPSTMIK